MNSWEIPKWDKKKPYVLVNEKGNWLNYPTRNFELVYVEPFRADLKLIGFSRGRSAANFDFRNVETGVTYTMFMKDFMEYLKQGDVIDSTLSGVWTVAKRGANYGIKLA